MGKTLKKLAGFIGMIIGIIVSIAIGGAFIEGVFLNVVILKYLPEVVHTIVGWAIIIGAILSGLLALVNYLKK